MIRSHFGLQRNPFDPEAVALLAHQQEIFDILRVHAQQGGLCLVLGEPGTGKSVLKQTLLTHDPKRLITPVVNRTLHTYHNTLRILCEAFQIEFEGRDHHCERLLVQQAFSVHRAGKMLVPIIDDAHLMPADCLRKLRLLCEDFPRSHNLVLIGQPPLLQSLSLSINEEIRSRVTYSALLPTLGSRNSGTVHFGSTRPRWSGSQYLQPGSLGPHRPLRRGPSATHSQSLPEFAHRSRPRPDPHRGPQTGQPRPHSTPLEERL